MLNEFSEVKKRIRKMQQDYAVAMNYADKGDEILFIDSTKWQDASDVADGAKFIAVDQYYQKADSNSLVFVAPKGSVIEKHNHSQVEFCICLTGKLKFIINDNEHVILDPIESIYIKAYDYHEVEFLEDTQIIVTWFPKLEF